MHRTTVPLAEVPSPRVVRGNHTLALFSPIAYGVACLTKSARMLTDCLAVTHRTDPHIPEQGAAAYSCTVHAGTHSSVLVQQPEATGAVSLLGQ